MSAPRALRARSDVIIPNGGCSVVSIPVDCPPSPRLGDGERVLMVQPAEREVSLVSKIWPMQEVLSSTPDAVSALVFRPPGSVVKSGDIVATLSTLM